MDEPELDFEDWEGVDPLTAVLASQELQPATEFEDWEEVTVVPGGQPQLPNNLLLAVCRVRLEHRKIQQDLIGLEQSLTTRKIWAEEEIRRKSQMKLKRRLENFHKKYSKNEKATQSKQASVIASNEKYTQEDITNTWANLEKKNGENVAVLTKRKEKCETTLAEYRSKCEDPDLMKQRVEEILAEYDILMKSVTFRITHQPGFLANVTNPFVESLFLEEFQMTNISKLFTPPEMVTTGNSSNRRFIDLMTKSSGNLNLDYYFIEYLNWNIHGRLVLEEDRDGNSIQHATWMEKYASSLNMEFFVEASTDFSQKLHVMLKVLREKEEQELQAKADAEKPEVVVLGHTGKPKPVKAAKDPKKTKVKPGAKGGQVGKKNPVVVKKATNSPFQKDLETMAILDFDRKMEGGRKIVFKILGDKNLPLAERQSMVLSTLLTITRWLYVELSTKFSPQVCVALFVMLCDIKWNFSDLTSQQTSSLDSMLKEVISSPVIQSFKKHSIQSFQLSTCGPYMLKELNPKVINHPDITFTPDAWQYDLIKLIDQDQTVLVVVPTSAGKTFSSFYVISRMLEKMKKEKSNLGTSSARIGKGIGSLTSRVVFVAPTFALVNQMSADIYHRYGKERRCGIYTSEFRSNIKNCEIMICTPEIFQMLLFLPENQQWASELLYVIFDEIHCIAEQHLETTASPMTYTQVLSLVQCPFLALSATVKEPTIFRDWLKKLHPERDVHLIPGNEKVHRWTDLLKYQFLPDSESFGWLPKEDAADPPANSLIPLHPFSMFKNNLLETIEDIDFSPNECLSLYQAMKTVIEGSKIEGLPAIGHLDPTTYFKNPPLTANQPRFENLVPIRRTTCYTYQDELRTIFKALPADQQHAVADALRQPKTELKKPETQQTEEDFVIENSAQLFFSLKQSSMLPAICFVFQQELCEKIVTALVQKLEKAEPEPESKKSKRVRDPTKPMFKEVVDKEEKETGEEANEMRSFVTEMKEFQKIQITAQIDSIKQYRENIHFQYSLLTEDPFDSDIEWWLRRLLKKTGWKTSHPLIRGLMRGMAAYHAHLPKPYRDLVETLFRESKIRVIISTTALSLGINMPCKTVVFMKDSENLDTVAYKQMAGRAGRRGFDHLGYTVFFDVGTQKIQELTFSPLHQLKSAVAVDIDTFLKMLILYSEADVKSSLPQILSKLMILPLNRENDQQFKIDFQLFLRAGIEFFFRMKLVDEKCNPVGLARFVSGISQDSKSFSNFALAYLIANHAFDEICQPFDLTQTAPASERKEAKQKLLHVLSLLFFNVEVPAGDVKCNALPRIPEGPRNDILQYNQETQQLYDNFFKTVAAGGFEVKFPAPLLTLQEESKFNNYVNDFFRHKKIRYLADENLLPDYDAYILLKSWKSFLKNFEQSLSHLYLFPEANPLCLAVMELSREFEMTLS